jgi:hypothetical protein
MLLVGSDVVTGIVVELVPADMKHQSQLMNVGDWVVLK